MILQRQTLFLDRQLLQIRRLETRQVVTLLHYGWTFCRRIAGKVCYVCNDFVRLKVGRIAGRQIIDTWVKFFKQDGQFYYYKLKDIAL